MEKIILAVDALNPDRSALEFASYLGRLTRSDITGVFLEDLASEERPVLKELHGMPYMDWEANSLSGSYQYKVSLIERNIEYFKEGCINRGVNYKLHRDRGLPVHELIEESRYADLLIVDTETSFSKMYEGIPTEFVRDVLKKTECPVIIAPENFEEVEEIIFTYNGTSSSLFAMKQFSYLFPQFHHKKAILLTVTDSGEWEEPDDLKLKEWLETHYSDYTYEVLKGKPGIKLFDYLYQRKNIFIVMGAYGRNAVSRFFKASEAENIIKTISQPIFIAHF
ncbi:MAG: universal stress protein [Bacteroidota bacterium]|nr:universal stress protein [Bacteroidota bacterium]